MWKTLGISLTLIINIHQNLPREPYFLDELDKPDMWCGHPVEYLEPGEQWVMYSGEMYVATQGWYVDFIREIKSYDS